MTKLPDQYTYKKRGLVIENKVDNFLTRVPLNQRSKRRIETKTTKYVVLLTLIFCFLPSCTHKKTETEIIREDFRAIDEYNARKRKVREELLANPPQILEEIERIRKTTPFKISSFHDPTSIVDTPYRRILFDLPDSWRCWNIEIDTLCSEENVKNAVVVTLAKQRGPQDTLEKYKEYLSKPKIHGFFYWPSNKQTQSEVISVAIEKINGTEWVVAHHFNSEIPNHHTYYFATVKDETALVVIFSYYKYDEKKYIKILKIFKRSLRLNRFRTF